MGRSNSKQQIISYENSIQKSNELSMAKLNHGLTLNQMQLLAFSIFSTQKDGVTEFHKSEFEKKFEIVQYRTNDAKKDSQRILGLQVAWEDLESDTFEYWNVFAKMKYKNGLFSFTWTEDMIPHILELKDKYVTTDLTVASKFKSSFSWTLYDYINSHYDHWYKIISKEALMKLFGVENKKAYLNNTSLFKKYVLDIAIKEINEHTGLIISYKDEKEGRSIAGFKIEWSSGARVTGATKKQIKEIQGLIDIVFDDMFQYVNINDENDRQRAIRLIQEIEEMRAFTSESIGITSEKASNLIQKAVWNFRELNRLLKKNHRVLSTGSLKKVEFYNWLEERD